MPEFQRRVLTIALVITYAVVPLFPVFIVLTGVQFPGVSVVPKPVAFALLGFIAAGLIAAAIILPRNPGPRSPVWRPSCAWLLAAIVAALAGFNPRDGLLFTFLFAAALIWQAGVWRGYREPGVPRAIFWSWIASGTLAAIAALAMVITRVPAEQYTIAHGRAVGTFVLPGELAGYMILFIPVAFAIARVARERALRFCAIVGCIAGCAALAMSFSRAGWIGFGAAVAVLVAVNVRSRTGRIVFGAGVLAVAFAVVLVTFNVHHNPSENYTRLTIWQAAVQIINRYPLTGVGPFGFERAYALARLPDGDPIAFHAHSIYLTLLAELGIAGFAAFVWTLWSVFASSIRRIAVSQGAARIVATALLAGLAGTLVQGVIDVISVLIFGLWLPTFALTVAAADPATEELGVAR